MNLDFKNVKFYPPSGDMGQMYRAIGCIDLYDTEGKIAGTIRVDVPNCRYEEIEQMLIAIDCVSKEVDE